MDRNGSFPSLSILGPARHRSAPASRLGGVGALLGAPLVAKLLGANLLVVATVAAVASWRHLSLGISGEGLFLLIGALTFGFAVSVALVLVALQPIRELDRVAAKVASGDLDHEIVPTPLFDEQISRVSRALNRLVSDLRADRSRMRRLAMQVIRAQDEERARIARELHDSTAQTLAALQLQLSATSRELSEIGMSSEDLIERFDGLRDLAGTAVEEVRLLSHTVYPRILDDLGLPAALEWLSRRSREQDSIDVGFEVVGERLPSPAHSAALYRVAQEAIRNAVRHSGATQVLIRLTLSADAATLTVSDDGHGFDLAAAESQRPGMGLFAMRERVSLVNGYFAVDSKPGHGTTVRAAVPLAERVYE